MVSASTLIGPFEFDRALATRPLLTARSQVNNGRVAMDGVVGLPIILIIIITIIITLFI